uniref:Uncharacterized protein n=1 Tax=Candidatus Kentrum sp. SD TaxID=2126332 RepID=A0A450YMT7_9GAMM|nr:MAG: hypothetical protein BECKSD772F_GA0070984_102129 [Candidatus Kentron sp. SD]VFK42871.1 MAG: hypothetical protein BECKSD772E_GA0070983_102029 [Candidatus Kentron sp. SD]
MVNNFRAISKKLSKKPFRSQQPEGFLSIKSTEVVAFGPRRRARGPCEPQASSVNRELTPSRQRGGSGESLSLTHYRNPVGSMQNPIRSRQTGFGTTRDQFIKRIRTSIFHLLILSTRYSCVIAFFLILNPSTLCSALPSGSENICHIERGGEVSQS